MMCLGVVLFGYILFGILCAFWTCMSISFTKLGKFLFIIFSNKLLIFCSFSSPSSIPMIQMLVCLMLFQRLLNLYSFFFVLFFFLLFFFKVYFIDYAIIFVPFFLPFIPFCPISPFPPASPVSSCPWVIHISSLASPFPILFLTSSCLFCNYQLYFLFPVRFPFFPFLLPPH